MHGIKRTVQIMVICCFMLAGCQGNSDESVLQTVEREEIDHIEDQEDRTDAEAEACIYVHVCGEVKNPGVYKLPMGSRIFEAVEAAGGLTEDAEATVMNLAAALEDGEQIYILSRAEAEAQAVQRQEAEDGKVDLNRASAEELMTLSGIGEARAEAIIQYREANGGFRSIEQLMEISGIKEGLFQKIKDQVKVE